MRYKTKRYDKERSTKTPRRVNTTITNKTTMDDRRGNSNAGADV